MRPAGVLKSVRPALLTFLLLLCVPALLPAAGPELTILTWNVENLFDDREQGGEYADYRGGRWTAEDFRGKIACLADAIASSRRGGPDILALQEVENRRALEGLQDALGRLGYPHAAMVPEGISPVSVAFLSRHPIVRTRAHLLNLQEEPPLRPILEIEVEVGGVPLILFNNHWKSKTQGLPETEPARLRAAAVLVRRLRALQGERPGVEWVVLGDMNENLKEFNERGSGPQTALIPAAADAPGAYARESLFLVPPPADGALGSALPAADGRLLLIEPWYELAEGERGSYVYRGRWQTPDHILLSPGCFDGRGWEYAAGSFRPLYTSADKKPRRFAAGGCSDHLPLLLVLKQR
jgi:endonuclease/exonuclease/phosphatase family metal-dependent hydrolase